jgi:hypothetical protein
MKNVNAVGNHHADPTKPKSIRSIVGMLFSFPKYKAVLWATTIFFFSMLSSCSVIGNIFQAGMGFGIFLVLLLIGVIILVVVKMGKK